jgi:L-2-hydroxyglutarate oxidase LhgO
METSTHNSGVIHAGIYYPKGSLKARLCVDGLRRLYEYCAARGVPHQRIGKLVLGESEQIAELEALLACGHANGSDELRLVDVDFVTRREPHVRAMPGIFSPATGIVETEALVKALAADCRDRDVAILTGTRLMRADTVGRMFQLTTGQETFRARTVVNAAGLFADEVSHTFGGQEFRIYPARGEYAEIVSTRREWIRGLVYPMPGHAGHLGSHLTKTTHGNVLIGPSMRYQEGKEDYESDRRPLQMFLDEARHLLPDLKLDDLRMAGSGIRAKLHPPEQAFADFLIARDANQPALIHAAGIDSPGLTSCLAIGEMVAELVRETL